MIEAGVVERAGGSSYALTRETREALAISPADAVLAKPVR